MTIAVFDWAAWSALYPRLVAQGVNEVYATALFNGPAGLFLNNTDASPIADVNTRTTLLYMITAHLAALEGPNSQGTVGRLASASEGSVSVSFDYGTQSASAAYWLQTPYGAQYWQASAPYRTMLYVPAPPSPESFPMAGFPPYIRGGGWRGW